MSVPPRYPCAELELSDNDLVEYEIPTRGGHRVDITEFDWTWTARSQKYPGYIFHLLCRGPSYGPFRKWLTITKA